MAKPTIEKMCEIAASRGGECLSENFINNRSKLLWKCAEGHEWTSTPSHIKHGSWCPTCVRNRRKLPLAEMQQLAAKHGGKCLSTEYVNSLTRLEWECTAGHRWLAKPGSIKIRKSWCPVCANRVSHTIESMQDVARERSGECLSTAYEGAHSKLLWRCEHGHTWRATPSNVKNNGTWCLVCAGSQQLTIEQMRELAAEHSGKCLSDKYINSATPLLWECSKGHQWEARPNDIRQGKSWCAQCSGKIPLTIDEFQRLAKERGGKCLSQTYVNNHTVLLFECEAGHQWEAIPTNFKHGETWCPFCIGKNKTIEDMQALAAVKGGLCLSTEYSISQEKLRWRCALGHEWESVPGSIVQGGWCPACSNSVSERVCRAYFEAIFAQKFPSRKPKWLNNSRGNRMELDGYCPDLNLAFEYQGIQHFKRRSGTQDRFHQDHSELRTRMEDDRRKMDLCAEHGVILIDVPYTVGHGEMCEYIADRCRTFGVKLPDGWKTRDVDLVSAYSPNKTREMQELAHTRGGKFISELYRGGHVNHEWECSRGHRWHAHPSHVKRGAWCGKCYHLSRRKTPN